MRFPILNSDSMFIKKAGTEVKSLQLKEMGLPLVSARLPKDVENAREVTRPFQARAVIFALDKQENPSSSNSLHILEKTGFLIVSVMYNEKNLQRLESP